MRSYFSPTFAARYGAQPISDGNLTQFLPPMIADKSHLSVDLTPLLVFGEFRIDGFAYHNIVTSDDPESLLLGKALKTLHDYELLSTFDATEFSEFEKRHVESMVSQATGEKFDGWLEQCRINARDWLQQYKQFRKPYPERLAVPRRTPFLVQAAIYALGLELNQKNADRFINLLFEERDKSEEIFTAQESMIEAAACYVASNEVWRSRNGNGPALDWQNMDMLSEWNDGKNFGRSLEQSKLSVAKFSIEKIAGQNPLDIDVEKYVAFLRSKSIEGFREYVDEVVSQCRDSQDELEKTALALIDSSNTQDELKKWKIAVSLLAPAAGATVDCGFELLSNVEQDFQENITDNYVEEGVEGLASSTLSMKRKLLRVKSAKAIRKYLKP